MPNRRRISEEVTVPGPTGFLFGESAWPGGSADFQSAVSPNCIRHSVEPVPGVAVAQHPAECNSALQQSATLRYDRYLTGGGRVVFRNSQSGWVRRPRPCVAPIRWEGKCMSAHVPHLSPLA